MHQTTSGETLKIKIVNDSSISQLRKDILNDFDLRDLDSCLYEGKFVLDNRVLNFLNIQSGDATYTQLKYLIRQAYDDIESIFPYLGDVFLHKFLNVKYREYSDIIFQQKHKDRLINSLRVEEVKNIAEWYFNNCNLSTFVEIGENLSKDIIISQKNDLTLNFEFDNFFLGRSNSHKVENYKFVIIDGMIESEGEIFHLISKAEKNKLPYVIFCFGMSDEVKHRIAYLNSSGKTEIIPISIKFSEETANILADIAAIHSSDIVTSLKGETISQAVRNSLQSGKSLTIYREKISITPVCSSSALAAHRSYLRKRKETSAPDVDTSCIDNRIKSMNLDYLKITYPAKLKNNIAFIREIDYFMKFLNNIRKPVKKVKFNNQEKYIPAIYLDYLDEKINVFKEKYNNIQAAVILV